MITVDAQLKLLATVVSLYFVVVLLGAGARRPTHLALSAFFVLLAANQGAEAFRALSENAAHEAASRRFATVVAALDPFALYYFSSVYPTPNERHRTGALLAVGVPGALLALWAGWGYVDPFPARDVPVHHLVYPVLLEVYTVVVYASVLGWSLANYKSTGSGQARLLAIAFGIAAFLPAARLGGDLWRQSFYVVEAARDETLRIDDPWVYLIQVCAFAAIVGLAVLMRRRHAPATAILPGVALAVVIVASDTFQSVVEWTIPSLASVPTLVGRMSTSLRWLLFGALVSVAIVRFDALGLPMRGRQWAARVLIMIGVATLGAFLLATFSASTGAPPWALFAIAAAIGLSQGFQRFVDRVAWALFGVPMETDAEARVEAYRLAVLQAVGEGRADDPALARLARDLRIHDDVAHAIAASAEADVGALPGAMLARRYRVERLVGRGTGGRAFLARDVQIQRDVIIKEIPHEGSGASALALREARLAGELHHPSVVTLFDVLPRKNVTFLVTEFVPGGSLDDAVRERGVLRGQAAAAMLEGILSGVAAIHAKGVVHRDLKPANILLAADGFPKIADFGLARVATEHETQQGGAWMPAGTPLYMSPEQRRAEAATSASDVYAIGLIARRCFADLPAAHEAAVARALADAPASRWAHAGEMLGAIRGYAQ